jgi:hypothetical protein
LPCWFPADLLASVMRARCVYYTDCRWVEKKRAWMTMTPPFLPPTSSKYKRIYCALRTGHMLYTTHWVRI